MACCLGNEISTRSARRARIVEFCIFCARYRSSQLICYGAFTSNWLATSKAMRWAKIIENAWCDGALRDCLDNVRRTRLGH